MEIWCVLVALTTVLIPTKDSERLSDLRLSGNDEAIDPTKTYSVSGWASVGAAPEGRLIWDIVRDYILKARDDDQVLTLKYLNTPKLIGVSDNPGLADYAGELG